MPEPRLLFWNAPQEALLLCLLAVTVIWRCSCVSPSYQRSCCCSCTSPLLLPPSIRPSLLMVGGGGGAAVKSQWCHSRMWQSRWAAFSPPLLTVSGVPSSASGALERSGAAKDDHRHRHRLKLRRAPTLSSCCSDPRRWVPDLPSSPHQPSPPPMPKDGT